MKIGALLLVGWFHVDVFQTKRGAKLKITAKMKASRKKVKRKNNKFANLTYNQPKYVVWRVTGPPLHKIKLHNKLKSTRTSTKL